MRHSKTINYKVVQQHRFKIKRHVVQMNANNNVHKKLFFQHLFVMKCTRNGVVLLSLNKITKQYWLNATD